MIRNLIVTLILPICSLFILGCTNISSGYYVIMDDGVYYYRAVEEGSYEKENAYMIKTVEKQYVKEISK